MRVKFVGIEDLLGQTITSIKMHKGDYIAKITTTNYVYDMFCERSVEDYWVEDIVGDLDDLFGSPITMAEEVIGDYSNNIEEGIFEGTFAFYKLATNNGYVTIRWCGIYDENYSEKVFISREIK